MPKVIDRPWPPRSTIITGDDVAAVGACLNGLASYLRKKGPRFEVTVIDSALAQVVDDGGYIKRGGGIIGDGDGDGEGYGSGYVYGEGDDYGVIGYGYSDGDGDGDGSGYGSGYGYSDGNGDGSGEGCGYDDGDGASYSL